MFGRGNLGLAGRGGGHLFISIREHFVFGGISPPTLFESLLQFLSLIKYLLHGSEYNIEKCFVTMRNIIFMSRRRVKIWHESKYHPHIIQQG